MRTPAFTLIELLVVITIIVVLLALLMPALDRAIYQAELAACAANLKGIATGVTLYAMEHKRSYPPRDANAPGYQPHLIEKAAGTGRDSREPIQDYITTKSFMDPLTPDIDYEVRDGADIYVPYNMWWSWRYGDPPQPKTKPRTTRMGSPFTWTEEVEAKEYEFYLLVGDYDETWDGGAWSNHPDRDGLMWHPDEENALNPISSDFRIFISRWYSANGQRGPLDLNFAYQDNSMQRLTDLSVQDDERTVKTPQTMGGNTVSRYTRLPLPLP